MPPKSRAKVLGGLGSGVLAGKFGRYRIVRAIGSGAMGTVYLAEDTQLGRQVALKTPHFQDDPSGELLKRFYREAAGRSHVTASQHLPRPRRRKD